eukprot:m.302913 g.302913  ORF g.302913 m.302913 type:complete len:81 (+) comp16314_c3_seq2:20073-20315(+)
MSNESTDPASSSLSILLPDRPPNRCQPDHGEGQPATIQSMRMHLNKTAPRVFCSPLNAKYMIVVQGIESIQCGTTAVSSF